MVGLDFSINVVANAEGKNAGIFAATTSKRTGISQHRPQCGMQLHRRAQRTAQAVAARQVVAQELVDASVIEHACRQVAHRHPVREVRHAVQATTGGVGRVPAALQSLDVRRNLGRQRAFKQPGLKQGVESPGYWA